MISMRSDSLGANDNADDLEVLCNQLVLLFVVLAEATLDGLLTHYCIVLMIANEPITQYLDSFESLEKKPHAADQA